MIRTEHIQISDELFLRLGNLITQRYGIKMPVDKKIMFQSRLQRRLNQLEISSFEEYARLLLFDDDDSKELTLLADYISTNKTEFFREKDHFQYISEHILPDLLAKTAYLPKLKFWSAGCSNGQEAYSLAITVEEYMRQKQRRIEYSVQATDISVRMLKTAREAVYLMADIKDIPLELKQRYFLKSKDLKDQKVRIIKDIRDKVSAGYLNLMDEDYHMNELFDLVFLRNTLIYFSKEVQQMVLLKVLNSMKSDAYLFIGHSESLINMDLPIRSIAPSIYMKSN